jgi:hypothetical protein
MTKIQQIQTILGVEADGYWGPISQAALDDLTSPKKGQTVRAQASSFADTQDINAFMECKRKGKTDKQCFAVGDNGIGQFGKVTAQEHTPMCALHAKDMIARWGSVAKAAHKYVLVAVGDRSIKCAVEDRMSAPGRIDLNPAAAKVLGLKPPFLVDCVWRWV